MGQGQCQEQEPALLEQSNQEEAGMRKAKQPGFRMRTKDKASTGLWAMRIEGRRGRIRDVPEAQNKKVLKDPL